MFNTQPLSQRDARWESVPLGFNTAGSTIGTHGCLLTCITMAANGCGFAETPSSLNARLKALGEGNGFTGATRNLLVWAGIRGALGAMRVGDSDYCANGAPIERMRAELERGVPALVKLDMSPAPGLQEHWVLAYESRSDDFSILDPWPRPGQGNVTSLLTEYGFAGDIGAIIKTVVWLEGRANMPPSKLIVRVLETAGEAGLRIRQQPALDAAVLKRAPVMGELLVLEDAAAAISKIGAQGQWLNVRDIEGDEGFVAAWYVGQRAWTQPLERAFGMAEEDTGKKKHKKDKKRKKKGKKK